MATFQKGARITVLLASCLILNSCATFPYCKPCVGKASTNTHERDRILSVLWYRYAAERQALSHQAYNIARDRLDQVVATSSPGERLALITDIDETLLDNSPFQASLIASGETYNTTSWTNWSSLAKAEALEGAQAFLSYAVSQGVHIFYVSKRSPEEQPSTMNNLRRWNFPMVDTNHVILVRGSKEPSRESIRTNGYKVILFLGDNLDDFSDTFEKKPTALRSEAVSATSGKFGREFIVLPNPMYGTWESAFYDYSNSVSAGKQLKRRRNLIKAADYRGMPPAKAQ